MSDASPKPTESFSTWFDRQGFRHFTAEEFTSYFGVHRRGVTNSAPPREMWASIAPTLRIVDALRAELGKPCVILSSYRSPSYNAAISGAAAKSYHMRFIALDIAFSGYSPKQVYDRLITKRARGDFKGGLGLYATFVHIDTRGYNATW